MLFSLFDTKACSFGSLIALENAEVARRNFVMSMLSPEKSPVKDFPDDYILYEMGGFDNHSGAITVHACPIKVMTGFEAVEEAKRYILRKQREELENGIRGEESSNLVSVESDN